MLSLRNKGFGFVPVLVSLSLWMGPTLCVASLSAKITNVNVSPDLKRLVVKGEGNLPYPTISQIPRSSKVVMDFPRCSLGDVPRAMRPEGKLAREVRAEQTRSGARITVDFGEGPIPEHRLSKIDDCLMVLFGETPSEPAALPARPQLPVVGETRQEAKPRLAAPVSDESGTASVLIKRARVVNGAIVLDVAPRNKETDVYRVTLGLDFRQPGFTTAKIHRVSALAKESSHKRKLKSPSGEQSSTVVPMLTPSQPPADPTPQTTKRGPTRVGAYRVDHPKAERNVGPRTSSNPILGACAFLLSGSQ